jgi:hypothetical protein
MEAAKEYSILYSVSVVLFSRTHSHLIYLILTYHFERMTEPHPNAKYHCKTCKQMFFLSYSKVVEHKSMIGHQEYEGEEKR